MNKEKQMKPDQRLLPRNGIFVIACLANLWILTIARAAAAKPLRLVSPKLLEFMDLQENTD
tara:strand:+ start:2231 stop:2413 length:183 start_codon:yes stop_codon:yes gene_type:complete